MSGLGSNNDAIWSFGYGSNMDAKSLEKRKGIKPIETVPAILKDYRLGFKLSGYPYVEPSYANVEASEGSEVHGMAFKMTIKEMESLDKTETVYAKHYVKLISYDGRTLDGFIYVNSSPYVKEDLPPSKRYMQLVITGAINAGLKDSYVEYLKSLPTYAADHKVLKLRKKRKKLDEYPEVTLEQLKSHTTGSQVWTSVMGFIVELVVAENDKPAEGAMPYCEEIWEVSPKYRGKPFPGALMRGRDITARQLILFNSAGTTQKDNGGEPPFPVLRDLDQDQLEYLTQWLDFLQARRSQDCVNNIGPIVGHLKEFREEQEQADKNAK